MTLQGEGEDFPVPPPNWLRPCLQSQYSDHTNRPAKQARANARPGPMLQRYESITEHAAVSNHLSSDHVTVMFGIVHDGPCMLVDISS